LRSGDTTMTAPSSSSASENQHDNTTPVASNAGPSSSKRSSLPQAVPGVPQHPNGLDIVLGLDTALDLGLGRLGNGMNFFDLGLIPSMSGCGETSG